MRKWAVFSIVGLCGFCYVITNGVGGGCQSVPNPSPILYFALNLQCLHINMVEYLPPLVIPMQTIQTS